MTALRPHATAHIAKYPVETLEPGTLRTLRDECARWIWDMDLVTASFTDEAERAEFVTLIAEDYDPATITLATINSEIKRRWS